jgi:hypothetical protein
LSCNLSLPTVIFKLRWTVRSRWPAGLNVNATPFNMDGLFAAVAGLHHECRLRDFVLEKQKAWFKCVEAQLEDAKVVKSKDKYNKVLGKLPVHIIEKLAPVTDNPFLRTPTPS